jgi:hypothetical protein
MTLSSASKRWVLLVTLLVYLGRDNHQAEPRWLTKRLLTQVSLRLPQGASREMTSAPIDQSGAGNRAPVRLYAGTSKRYACTCSAPFSFSGRLRTTAFVNRVITKLSPMLNNIRDV